MKEITWYGRGGQGAFTASRILGAAATIKGYNALAFPSFGPERRGAPIRAFTKISEEKISDRSIVKQNDYIIILDDSLFDKELLKKLKPGGRLFINTVKNQKQFGDERIIAGDISSLAEKILNRPIVNIGILGLLLPVDDEIGIEEIYSAIDGYMPEKIAQKNKRLLEKVIEEGVTKE